MPFRINPKAWLNADPDRRAACFLDHWLMRASRAYLVKREDRIYRFGIEMIDVNTGLKIADLTLAIPFDGDFAIPKAGVSFGSGPVPVWTITQWPHILGIGGLQIEGNVLRIIMKPESDELRAKPDPPAIALEFDIRSLIEEHRDEARRQNSHRGATGK